MNAFRLRALCLTLLWLGIPLGCANDEPPPRLQRSLEPILVSDLPRMGGDYPEALIGGLSRQLIDEVNCIQPGVLARFEVAKTPGRIFTDRNIPYLLRPEVVRAAEAVAATKNDFMTITSGYRDVGMQYYDWLWGQRLGFMAARPGESRHQAGQAIDLAYYSYWRDALLEHGWSWPYGTDDAPHFEWVELSEPNLMVESVRAFQRLWNRNHPEDQIVADGVWGPSTEERMATTHAEGFRFGGCDDDRDGHASTLIGGGDCNDADPSIHPGALEVCEDGIDQDCDGRDLGCDEDYSPPEPIEELADSVDSAESEPGDTLDDAQDLADSNDAEMPSELPVEPSDDVPLDGVDSSSDGESFSPWSTAPTSGRETESACGCRLAGVSTGPIQILLLLPLFFLRRRAR